MPDQAAFRCDSPAWLKTLPDRDRQIAKTLSTGKETSKTAKQFGDLGSVDQSFLRPAKRFNEIGVATGPDRDNRLFLLDCDTA